MPKEYQDKFKNKFFFFFNKNVYIYDILDIFQLNLKHNNNIFHTENNYNNFFLGILPTQDNFITKFEKPTHVFDVTEYLGEFFIESLNKIMEYFIN